MPDVKALFFDVFGTLVDWRTSIAREAQTLLKPFSTAIDWLAFADAWRGEYQPAMTEVREGRIPFCKLDALHRKNLDRILPRFGADVEKDAELEEKIRRMTEQRLRLERHRRSRK